MSTATKLLALAIPPLSVCVNQDCASLPIPPFPPPKPPSNNTLVIAQNPQPPPECQGGLTIAARNYEESVAEGLCGPVKRVRVLTCGATVEGCQIDLFGQNNGFVCSDDAGSGSLIYDSYPNFRNDVNLGLQCKTGILSINDPPPPPIIPEPVLPPPPPGRKFYPGCCTNKVIV